MSSSAANEYTLPSPATPRCDNEVLVRVEGVSKKFCRDLKKSLWYGVKDVASELLPIQNSKSQNQPSGGALRPGEFWANKDISFELRRGECLGLIGRNGAGKTTLLKILNGLIKPDTGRVQMLGRVKALIALGAGFNPILTGRENIYVNGSVLGLSKREIDIKIDHIIEFAELKEFIDSPVQSYSSGMHVRLGFSVAVNLIEPDVLILDEVLAVGDAAFRAKCEKRISELIKNTAVLFVSHDSSNIRRLCDKVLWLDQGKQKAVGDTSQLMSHYERTTPRNAVASSLTRMEGILKIVPKRSRIEIGYGGRIHLSIEITSDRPIPVESIVLGIADGGNLVAQTNIDTSFNLEGASTIHLETGNLYLKTGTYLLNVALYGMNYKNLVARYMAFGELRVESEINGYCYYQFPATARLG